MDAFGSQYYVYSFTIARVCVDKCTEIKNHQSDSWEKVTDPKLWQRIQNEGNLVSEAEANEIYNEFHRQVTRQKQK